MQEAVPVPGAGDCVVLLRGEAGPRHAWGAHRRWQNLIRLRPDRSLAWRAELPDPRGYDAYEGVAWTGAGLRAWSWSGFQVLLDADSGRIRSATFTK